MILKWYACVCVCVCVCVDVMNLKYALCWYITYQFIPCYANAIHKPHTRILKPFEDSKPTGLKVDIA